MRRPGHAQVMLAVEAASGREYAIKVLDKRHIIKEKKVKYVNVEKAVLNRTSHPFVIRLFYTFQDASSLCTAPAAIEYDGRGLTGPPDRAHRLCAGPCPERRPARVD
jgi:serine/threonine protein kinase